MNKTPFDLIQKNFKQGLSSQTAMSEAIAGFVTACTLGNWNDTEGYRIMALGALDQWLDNLAAAHRIAEEARED